MKDFVDKTSEEISEQQELSLMPEGMAMEGDEFGFVSKGTPTPQDDPVTSGEDSANKPQGIANLGSTCYAAATLQVFAHLYAVLGKDKP